MEVICVYFRVVVMLEVMGFNRRKHGPEGRSESPEEMIERNFWNTGLKR